MPHNWLWLCALGLRLAAPPTALASSIEQTFREPITAAIRWVGYWEGAEALGSDYRPGGRIEVRVLRAQRHLHAFLAPLGLRIDITASPPGFQAQAVDITGSPPQTNPEAVASFLQRRAQAGRNCSGQVQRGTSGPLKDQAGRVLPLDRPCSDQEAILGDETFLFVLPELTPPDSIQTKSLPSDKDALVAEVRRYLESRSKRCGVTTARIPFYSDTDPRIYVFFKSARNCPRGVATFSRAAEGRWEFGKFFADVAKEELSSIIGRIEANTALTLTQ
jgi:hypothetical protein